MLDAEGMPIEIDTTTYDPDVDGGLAFGGPAARNETKLRSLVDLDLFAKAGALVVTHARTMDSVDETDVAAFELLNSQYKHFVQAGMAVERWGDAWDAAVDWGFPGQPLEHPLDAEGVSYAARMLFDPPFATLRSRHFTRLPGMTFNFGRIFNIFNHKRAPSDPGRLAVIAALFYPVSPEGVDEALAKGMENGWLPADVDWHSRVHSAVTELGHT